MLRRLPKAEKGQGLAEYALILALIAVLAIAALLVLSGSINDILGHVGDCLSNPNC
jgi:pilus assembly protein Flp/PilA